MASPVYCWDEETPQNHCTRTKLNRLLTSLCDYHSGDGKAAWPKFTQGAKYNIPLETFAVHTTESARMDS
jgi:hypothetical protein